MKIRKLFDIFGERKSPLEKALSEAYSSKPELIPSTIKIIDFISKIKGFNGTQKELVDRIVQEFNVCVDSGDYLDNVQGRGTVSFKYLGEDSEGNILSRKVMLKGKTPVVEGLTPKEVRVLAASQLLIENSTAPLVGYDCFKDVLKQGNSMIPFDFGEYFEFGESCVEGVIPIKNSTSLVPVKKRFSKLPYLIGGGAVVAGLLTFGFSRDFFNKVNSSRLEKKLTEEAASCPFEIQPVFKEDKSPAKVVTEEKEIMGIPIKTYSGVFKFKHRTDFDLSCVKKMNFIYLPSESEKDKNVNTKLDTYLLFFSCHNEPTGDLTRAKYIGIYKFDKDSRIWEEKEWIKTDRPFFTSCVGRILDSDNYSIITIPRVHKWMKAEDPIEIYTFDKDWSLKKEKTSIHLSGGDILALDVAPDEKGLEEILFTEYRDRFRVARLSRDTNEEVQLNDLKTSITGVSLEEDCVKDNSGCILSTSGSFIPAAFSRRISNLSDLIQKRIVLSEGTRGNPDYRVLYLDVFPADSDGVVLSDVLSLRGKYPFIDFYSPIYTKLNLDNKSSGFDSNGIVCFDSNTPFLQMNSENGSFPMQIFDKPYQDRSTLDNVHYITSGLVDGVSTIAVATNLRVMLSYARDIKKK